MYEVLISHLRDCAKYDQYENTFSEAADAIEELEMACDQYEKNYKNLCEYLPKWIPVTERLPEPYMRDAQGRIVYYLVMLMDENLILMASRTDKCWIYRGDGSRLKGVTHWMPLPNPPEKGEYNG